MWPPPRGLKLAAMFGRSRYRFPITLSATLIALNVTLMVVWIALFARDNQIGALTIGAVAFALVLVGLIIWLVLSIKEINLNHRQANFVGAVTHELKTPIAALQLSLETVQMREMDEARRAEFYDTMAAELHRLDHLINQLLEVGRLDAIGEDSATERIDLRAAAMDLAQEAAERHRRSVDESVRVVGPSVHIMAQPMVLRLILSNLMDNAFKYGGDTPEVHLKTERSSGRARLRVSSNGVRIPHEDRKKIFRVFYRRGSELERRQTGTGLGLFIVATLTRRMDGRVVVRDRSDGKPGNEFVLELPAAKLLPLEPDMG